MSQLFKNMMVAGMLLTAFGGTAMAEGVRVRPVVAPTGPVKPTVVAKPLTRAEMNARIKPTPRYLTVGELKSTTQATAMIAAMPNLKADFSLTPATQSVSGRGSLSINGTVHVPNPPSPSFQGQASLRHTYFGLGAGGGWLGEITMTLKAQKGAFYAIDCLANVDYGSKTAKFYISGADSSQSGTANIANGHLVFNVRRSVDTGDIIIRFHPEDVKQVANLQGQMIDQNIMDFWGCQISSGS